MIANLVPWTLCAPRAVSCAGEAMTLQARFLVKTCVKPECYQGSSSHAFCDSNAVIMTFRHDFMAA